MGVGKTKASRDRSGRWPADWSDEEWSLSLFGALAKFRKATIGYVMSVRLSVRMKCDIGVFLENISIQFMFRYNRTTKTAFHLQTDIQF